MRRSPCENGSSGGDLSDPPSHVSSTLSKELGGLKDCQDPIQVSAAALATAQAMFAAAGKAADRVPPLGLLPGAHGFLNSPAHLQALRNPAFLQLTQNLGLPDPTDKQYAFDDQLKQVNTRIIGVNTATAMPMVARRIARIQLYFRAAIETCVCDNCDGTSSLISCTKSIWSILLANRKANWSRKPIQI